MPKNRSLDPVCHQNGGWLKTSILQLRVYPIMKLWLGTGQLQLGYRYSARGKSDSAIPHRSRHGPPIPGFMDAFSPFPPHWTETAIHATQFACPKCGAESSQARSAWVNRRSPVYSEAHQRKWQEFYLCACGYAWWAWSSDRPPSPYSNFEDSEIEGDPLF